MGKGEKETAAFSVSGGFFFSLHISEVGNNRFFICHVVHWLIVFFFFSPFPLTEKENEENGSEKEKEDFFFLYSPQFSRGNRGTVGKLFNFQAPSSKWGG